MPPPSKVMSCWTESLLVHTTVEPACTVIVAGEKPKFLISTASVATGVPFPAALRRHVHTRSCSQRPSLPPLRPTAATTIARREETTDGEQSRLAMTLQF